MGWVSAKFSKSLITQLPLGTDVMPAVAQGKEFPEGPQAMTELQRPDPQHGHRTGFQVHVWAEAAAMCIAGHGWEGTERALASIPHGTDGET